MDLRITGQSGELSGDTDTHRRNGTSTVFVLTTRPRGSPQQNVPVDGRDTAKQIIMFCPL